MRLPFPSLPGRGITVRREGGSAGCSDEGGMDLNSALREVQEQAEKAIADAKISK